MRSSTVFDDSSRHLKKALGTRDLFIRKCLSYVLANGYECGSYGPEYCACDRDRTDYRPPEVDGLLCQAGVPDMLKRLFRKAGKHIAYAGTDESQKKSLF